MKEVSVKRGKLSLLFIAVVCLSGAAAAQTSASVVKAQPMESVYKIKRGEDARIEVVLNIEDGYHVNSNRPPDKNLIPTELKIENLEGLVAEPVVYPKAKMRKFEFSPKPLAVFEGKTVLSFTARATPELAAGAHTIKGKLTVQACNHERCLRPQTVDVEIPIEVVE